MHKIDHLGDQVNVNITNSVDVSTDSSFDRRELDVLVSVINGDDVPVSKLPMQVFAIEGGVKRLLYQGETNDSGEIVLSAKLVSVIRNTRTLIYALSIVGNDVGSIEIPGQRGVDPLHPGLKFLATESDSINEHTQNVIEREHVALERVVASKRRRNLLIAAAVAGVLGIAAIPTTYYALAYSGDELARNVMKEAPKLSLVSVFNKDSGEDFGNVGNSLLNPGAEVQIHDKAINVNIEQLKPGGDLYYAYQALIEREDKWHEYGLGNFNPSTFATVAKSIPAYAKYKFGFSGAKPPGGSSLADQVCGNVWEKAAMDVNFTGLSKKYHESSCSIGLHNNLNPEEIGALYMTTTFIGESDGFLQFAKKRWGINDPSELTIGQQLVMAAAPPRPLGRNNATWPYVKNRAEVSLELLIDKGLIEANMQDSIMGEINRANPSLYSLSESVDGNIPATEAIRRLAVKEMSAYAERNNWGDQWRLHASDLVVSADLGLQKHTVEVVRHGVEDIVISLQTDGAFAPGTVLITDKRGDILAYHSSQGESFRLNVNNADRPLIEGDEPGSVGKLLLTPPLAKLSNSPDDLASVRRELKKSNPNIANSVRSLDVTDSDISHLINCFGSEKPDYAGGAIQAATTGNWTISPINIPSIFHAAATGEALPTPHVLQGYIDRRTGHYIPIAHNVDSRLDACANNVYQDGGTKAWFEVPTEAGGTLSGFQRLRTENVVWLAGKTGTVRAADDQGEGEVENTTNAIWAPFGVEYNNGEQFYGVVFVRGEQGSDGIPSGIDNNLDIGDKFSGSTVGRKISGKLIEKLNERME